MKHNWQKNENGNVDEWAWEAGFHNGVFCMDCGRSVCVHCDPDYMELDDCTGPEPEIVPTTAFSTLQAENEKLRAELEQVKRERDAAVADLEHLMLVVNAGECCMMCKHDHEHLTGPCAGQSTRCEPEWRGPQKED